MTGTWWELRASLFAALALPPAADVSMSEMLGACGSTILSVDGEGRFGGNPADGSIVEGTGWCCYPVHETCATCVYGRPYVADGAARVAEVVEGRGWCAPAEACDLPDEARELLREAWERAAQDEHAAVAAFAKVALELLGFGAPADLVDATLAAGREEVNHARLGFALASRYAGVPRSPGPLALSAEPPCTELARFAAATAREGCIGETVTALLAAECLARATDPAVRAALTHIVADEQGHAHLAWRTARWALSVGGPDVRAAIAAVFATVAERGMPLPDRLADGPWREILVAHGVPDEALARDAAALAVAEIVLPAARLLLQTPGVPAGARR